MQPQSTYPDAATRIKAIVQAQFGDIFHAYLIGLPDDFKPPKDAFPLIIFDTVGEHWEVGPTTADDITETVYVHVMVDIDTGFGAPTDDDNIKRQLKNLISGRDPTTGYLLPTSMMYALRTHLTLSSKPVPGQVTINNKINVTYAEGHYKDLPETRDAVLEITVYERQMVLNRD